MKTQTNPAQAYTNRIIKMQARKNGAKGQLKRRTKFATVACRIHGKIPSGVSGLTIPELRCSMPRNRREKYGGCPECAKLRKHT